MIHSLFAFLSCCCIISFSFHAFASAADSPSINNVTWLYPNKYTVLLAFNSLDIVNVSWISAYAPASLELACQNDSDEFSSAMKIQVPATGNRLISLNPAATYERCRFEISAPENTSNISYSPRFYMDTKEDRNPVFWTLDSLHANEVNYQNITSCHGHGENAHSMQHQQTMIGVGVGVAVGVFAITTLAYTLIIITIRKRQQKKEAKGSSTTRESMTKDWVLKSSLSSSGSGREVDAEGKSAVAEGWMEKQIRSGDFHDMRRRSRVDI